MQSHPLQAFFDWEIDCLRTPVERLDYFSLFGQGQERMLLAMREQERRGGDALSCEAAQWYEENLNAIRDALMSSLEREAAQVYFTVAQWLQEEQNAQMLLEEARAEPVNDWQKTFRVLYWHRAVDLAQLAQRLLFERLVTGGHEAPCLREGDS